MGSDKGNPQTDDGARKDDREPHASLGDAAEAVAIARAETGSKGGKGKDDEKEEDSAASLAVFLSADNQHGEKDELRFRKTKSGYLYWFLARPSRWRLFFWTVGIAGPLVALFLSLEVAFNYIFDHGFEEGYERAEIEAKAWMNPPWIDGTVPEGAACRRWLNKSTCTEAEKAKIAADWSLYYLKVGDAFNSVGRWSESRDQYRRAIDIGRPSGAIWAVMASRRLQLIDMACGPYDENSLARISRGYEDNPLGELIDVKQKQRALAALGHYGGEINNAHSAATRAAVREFQRDLLDAETGALTAEQTVLLICAGAQIVNDVSSQNVLGIMYGTGLGVRQNTDFAINWLESAAQRGDADALWNLAIMYGTGTIMSSVSLCDVVQSAERADSYLREAAALGHPAAEEALKRYPKDEPEDRWRKLRAALNQPEALERVGRACNPNG